MMRLFWVDGRFAWPFVVTLAAMTVFLVAFDFAWRLLRIPFESLVIYAAAIAIILLASGGVSYRLLKRNDLSL